MIILVFMAIPLIGAILSLLTYFLNKKLPRYMAFLSIMTCLFFSIFFFYTNSHINNSSFSDNSLIFSFYKIWIPRYGISFYLGVDKLSLLMIFLTSLMGICSISCEWDILNKNIGIFYFCVQLIILGIFGIFLSFDMLLFFFFWEIILIPMYFLIIFWNNSYENNCKSIYVARKFFIYSQLSSFILLFSILNLACIYHSYSGIWTFNYFILKNIKMSLYMEIFVMFSLLLSLVIKLPLFPFDDWLPDIQEIISPSGSVDLVGILLKPAIYGLLRYHLVLFPRTSHMFSLIFISLGLFTMLYGSIMAFSQTNIKRLLAYSSISNMGIIFASLYSENIFSYQGVMIYFVSYVISTAALLIIIGKIFFHIKTQNILYMGGLWSCMYFIPSFFLFFSFANLSIPLTGNFSGKFMMLWGIFSFYPVLGYLFAFCLFLSSIYSVILIQRVCYGSTNHVILQNELNIFHLIILIFFACFLILIGLYPKLFLQFSYEISDQLYRNYISFFNK
ncbi:NADH-quinone oxidoreductase subunit M [Buchnera aphidicola (Cinara piceae)]|uniref:NADH-quinone oxidoreductase subunit M n=1 Tax=Buchnera aphidicola (Cinara piceae) TaxID=1660043 RepID=A0A803FTM1_9GAMM|nr:NADH-quinone oxidoreductase subunit M [Buchnera aphidicola]VFP88070.1 NADH-quinone oxidoreductase subunit M [Buchnera aphidicola (Cinara piceae)]